MSADARWRYGTAAFWLFAGSLHFLRPKLYEPIVPPPLNTRAREVVYASGVAEALGGALILPAATRQGARWWLLATLVGVFPANVYMALEHERFKQIPRAALWARLPFQAAFAWVTWRATKAR